MPVDPAIDASSAAAPAQPPATTFTRPATSPRHRRTGSEALPNAPGRGIDILVAISTGAITALFLAGAMLRPAQAGALVLLAALTAGIGTAAVLALTLRRERARAAAIAARLEGLEDERWEAEEAMAGVETGGIAAGFEPLSIATVSHELRAPLHGMQGLAGLLAETELSGEQRAYVDALGQSATALGRVVEDLLDASRIATGHFALENAPTAIEPLIEQVAELMAPGAFAKGLGLSTRAERDLPVADIDAGRVRQVLINLVANAIRFSDSGGILIEAGCVAGKDNGVRLRFSVADTGRGVAPDDRARIFGSFERAAGSSGGAGLGLAISSRIVERMGTSLTLSPREGGGSVFAFDLDIAGSPKENATAAVLPGKRILVALLSDTEASTLASVIAAEGGVPIGAASEAAATALLGAATAADESFDVVLIDIRLLADAGVTAALLRQATGTRLAIVALVEPAERQRLADLKAAGFDAYLVRPLRRQSVLRVLADVASRNGAFVVDPADEARESATRRNRSPRRTLVVEDDPVSALLLRAVLEKLGHDVTEASNLGEARRALARLRPDLVLVDMRLGAEDGLSLIREIRLTGNGPDRPICIAMSADNAALDAAAIESGAELSIAKPVSPDSLHQAIAAADHSGVA